MNEALVAYASAHSDPGSPLLQELLAETAQLPGAGASMCAGPEVGALLKCLVAVSHAKRVLEIGTYTGYSALWMAAGMCSDGELITCEKDPRMSAIAERYFAKSEDGQKIRQLTGIAKEILPSLTGEFDMIFIDADKRQYAEYYAWSLDHLRAGGLIVLDDMLWRGEVLKQDSPDKRATALDELNKQILNDPRVENLCLPLRHGLQLVRKLA